MGADPATGHGAVQIFHAVLTQHLSDGDGLLRIAGGHIDENLLTVDPLYHALRLMQYDFQTLGVVHYVQDHVAGFHQFLAGGGNLHALLPQLLQNGLILVKGHDLKAGFQQVQGDLLTHKANAYNAKFMCHIFCSFSRLDGFFFRLYSRWGSQVQKPGT